ncbi:Ty3/gypsy retrotransposon protein [Quillaja saponaria]|uniref:Ty3/gypsy retrotransposon protein n=1 Tax=Quillaja saponaria TaxID=32244 RepID=A0AAD7PNV0_QUISA|nr:Ty3/gypsy retrotransposon protein [Quillaja saponaria]
MLFAKISKCTFGSLQIDYLGHSITAAGVSADPKKIAAINQWPTTRNVKELRRFLGLTGYYRRVIKDYGKINKDLTNLLKKNGFEWNQEAEDSFHRLKKFMTQALVMALPDYKESFILETIASGIGIRVILMQKEHPIAFLRKELRPKHLALSTYEKELIVIVYAVSKWKQYLIRKHLVIKTDQWLSKLVGLDYKIQYKKGKENKVADALSRVQYDCSKSHEFCMLSMITTDLVKRIVTAYQQDNQMLRPYKQGSVHQISFPKLSAKYYGPYKVIARVGAVAYVLDLPLDAKIHNVFHVSLLKKHHGTIPVQHQLPVFNDEEHLSFEPAIIIDRMIVKKGNRVVAQVLVQWSRGNREDCMWEDYKSLKLKFPQFNP